MDQAVLRYRVMAYVTGVVLIVLCFAGIPLQVAAHNNVIVNDVGTLHGILYIIYLVVSYLLTRRLRLAIGPTVLVLLAGLHLELETDAGVFSAGRLDPAVRERASPGR